MIWVNLKMTLVSKYNILFKLKQKGAFISKNAFQTNQKSLTKVCQLTLKTKLVILYFLIITIYYFYQVVFLYHSRLSPQLFSLFKQ
jgi:hypothetical protein